MEALSKTLVSQANHCLSRLEGAIMGGDTRMVRECAEQFRSGGRELNQPQLVKLADELEMSATECDLGASLRCMEMIRDILITRVSPIGRS